MKTPEEYFKDRIELPENGEEQPFTPVEQEFLRRYLGVEQEELLKKLDLHPGRDVSSQVGSGPGDLETDRAARPAKQQQPEARQGQAMPTPVPAPDEDEAAHARATGRDQLEELQLVSFYLGKQEFVVPITDVQEVVRRMEPTRLPTAPSFMAGIINLRGRVTPLVHLGMLLDVSGHQSGDEQFVIICKAPEMQIGLLVTRVSSMYRMTREAIEWNIDSNLGVASDLLAGLVKNGERLIGIVDVASLVDRVLMRNRGTDV
ncbi:MAG: chemotaxis protein CheW [Desulfovibrionales bacterium]